MGQVLHGSATMTERSVEEAVRRAIQHSQASLRALAKRYGINQKTVAKWKGRTSVADVPTGPKEPRSTVLSAEKRPSSLHSEGILCCRSTTACTLCSPSSRI
jgi:hypothetical protein